MSNIKKKKITENQEQTLIKLIKKISYNKEDNSVNLNDLFKVICKALNISLMTGTLIFENNSIQSIINKKQGINMFDPIYAMMKTILLYADEYENELLDQGVSEPVEKSVKFREDLSDILEETNICLLGDEELYEEFEEYDDDDDFEEI